MSTHQASHTLRNVRGWLLLLSLTLPHLAVTMAGQAPGVLAPWMQADLSLTRAQIGTMISVRFVASSFMFLISGALVERWGPALSMLAGMLLFGLSMVGLVWTAHLGSALILFFMAGLGFAAIHPATTIGLVREFRPDRRSTVMGLKETGVPIGGALATLFCPIIAISAGWRWAFLFCGLVAALSGIISWWLYRNLSVGQPAAQVPTTDWQTTVRLLARRDVMVTGVLQIVLMIAQFSVQVYLMLFLVEAIALSTAAASLVLFVVQVGSWVARVGWGLAADLLFGGRQWPMMLAICGVIAVSFGMLGSFGPDTPLIYLYGAGFLLGIGSQGWMGPIILLRSQLVGPELSPQVTAAGFSVGVWGAILGPPLFGGIVDLTHSYQLAWYGLAVLLLLTCLVCYRQGGGLNTGSAHMVPSEVVGRFGE